MKIPAPSPKVITEYLQRWNQLENYILQERSLNHLFHQLCPENKTIESVLLKVSALNDFYSTNIYDTYTVAKHILGMEIDSRLQECDLSLVNEMAKVTIKSKEKNFYSFSSKYCSHHKPNDFPIYDSYVDKMLVYYKKEDGFCLFKKYELKDYERFIEIITEFKRFYKLNKQTLRDIDIFLWLCGKKFFPNKY